MRALSIIGALTVAITCGLTLLGGLGLGYDASFDDKLSVSTPVEPVVGPVKPIAEVPTTTLMAVDSSHSVTVDEKIWR
jgi:hypothetical protein